MLIACDCHIHIYPEYDLELLLRSAWDNLHKLAPQSEVKAICLTERFDCHFCKNLATIAEQHPQITFKLANDAIRATFDEDKSLLILPGRQIVTAERLEILALTKDVTTPDGLSYQETFEDISYQRGLCVINWAPGKWFFKRGKLIKTIIETYPANSLLFCDTILRCTGWPEPTLMKEAKHKKFQVIAGSDPLPIPREEQLAGTYGISAHWEFDQEHPGESIRQMLLNSDKIKLIGRRNSPIEMLRRLREHKNNKHQ